MAVRVILPSQRRCCRNSSRWESEDPSQLWSMKAIPRNMFHPYQLMSASRFMEDTMGLFDDAAPLFWMKTPSQPQKGEAPPDKPTDFTSEFELSGFDPSEVKVKTIGQKVIVDATKEVKDEKDGCISYTRKEYHRSIVLPDNVNTEELASTLNEAGKLRITAPLIRSLENKGEREVPVLKDSANNATTGDIIEKKSEEDATIESDTSTDQNLPTTKQSS